LRLHKKTSKGKREKNSADRTPEGQKKGSKGYWSWGTSTSGEGAVEVGKEGIFSNAGSRIPVASPEKSLTRQGQDGRGKARKDVEEDQPRKSWLLLSDI